MLQLLSHLSYYLAIILIWCWLRLKQTIERTVLFKLVPDAILFWSNCCFWHYSSAIVQIQFEMQSELFLHETGNNSIYWRMECANNVWSKYLPINFQHFSTCHFYDRRYSGGEGPSAEPEHRKISHQRCSSAVRHIVPRPLTIFIWKYNRKRK